MIIKGRWIKKVDQDRIIAVSFDPIPEEGDPHPLYRVLVHVGPGADFGCLLNADEAQAGLIALESDNWKKEQP